MSTSVNTYVLLGVLLDYQQVHKLLGDDPGEQLEPLCDKADDGKVGDFVCLYDGMNGDYVALGRLLARGDEDSGGHLDAPVQVDMPAPSDLDDINRAILNAIPNLPPFTVKTLVICHYH